MISDMAGGVGNAAICSNDSTAYGVTALAARIGSRHTGMVGGAGASSRTLAPDTAAVGMLR